MKKLVYTLVFLGFLTCTGLVYADATGSSSTKNGGITVADLGIENPGILPTNPFYFLKEWQRSFQRRITRDPLKIAAYDLSVVNEQAAELAQLELYSQNADAIRAAVDRYTQNAKELLVRLHALQQTTDNPEVDNLIQQLTDLSVKHTQLMNQLQTKFADDADFASSTESAKNSIGDALAQVPGHFETPEKFQERLNDVLEHEGDGYSRTDAAIEVLGRVAPNLPEEAQQKVLDVTQELEDKFQQSASEDVLKIAPLMRELRIKESTSTKAEDSDRSTSPNRILPVQSGEKIEAPKTATTSKSSDEDAPVLKALNSAD